MGRARRFASCVFLPYWSRANVPAGAAVCDVSSYADFPYCTLSPIWVHGGIPVPGMPGTTSDTVEGIWQGLKVIRGAIAPRSFGGRGHKRGGKPAGHQFGNRLLGIVEARQQIFRVAYEWVLEHRVDRTLVEGWVEKALSEVTQYFHDVGDNGNMNDPDAPWAHAAALVQYLNRQCAERTGK